MKNQLFSRKTGQRIAWSMLAVLLWYEYFQLLQLSIRWHYNHPLIWPTWLLGLIAMEMAILHDHPWAIKLRRHASLPCSIVGALYIALSGLLLWMINVGWNGCFHSGQQDLACMETLFNVWTYFPITNPSVEIVLLSFHGFGGKNEIVGATATLLIASGLVWILNVTSQNKMTFYQKLIPSIVLVASAEAGFYGLYTVTQNVDSWPGFVAFFAIAAIFLMLDWLNRKTSSSEKMSEEKK